jgi:hypothetical protein
VDNPITLPNPRQNIQDLLRIYDSKLLLTRPVDNYAGAISVASFATKPFEVFDGSHEVAIVLLFGQRSESTRVTASPALETERSGTQQKC